MNTQRYGMEQDRCDAVDYREGMATDEGVDPGGAPADGGGAPAPAGGGETFTRADVEAMLAQHQERMQGAFAQVLDRVGRSTQAPAAPAGPEIPDWVESLDANDPVRHFAMSQLQQNHRLEQMLTTAMSKLDGIDAERSGEKLTQAVGGALRAEQIPEYGHKLSGLLVNALISTGVMQDPRQAAKAVSKLLGEYDTGRQAAVSRKPAAPLRVVGSPGVARTAPKTQQDARAALLEGLREVWQPD